MRGCAVCTLTDPADVHIGKKAVMFETRNEYNSNIAVKRVLSGVDGIYQKSLGFPIDKILFVGGNDILHTDNAKGTTTAGTIMDTSGMWHENFLMAKQLYIDVLLKLISIADVHYVFNPSNHDFITGFLLSDIIQTYFRDCKNITFDCDLTPRKYFKYHNNIIGTTHGENVTPKDLVLAMATECSDWSEVEHRYIYSHHIHRKKSEDLIGCTWESVRSPSGTDSWHNKKAFIGVPKAVEGFIHSKEHGQVARLTHVFSKSRL